MPSNYHLRSFWEQRFTEEEHFEWLGDGQDTLIPRLRAFLRAESTPTQEQRPGGGHPPRTLHIGAGNSTMSEHIRDAYEGFYGEQYLTESTIVNLDFSDVAVANGRQAGASTARAHWRGPRWVQGDILQWNDVAPLVKRTGGTEGDGDEELFALVLDKSTSDAVACGEDIVLTRSSTQCHPAIRDGIRSEVKVEPVHLLALNLAPLVRPGGVWIVLSYSSSRVSLLSSHESREGQDGDSSILNPGIYWSLEEHSAVDAPTGQNKEGVFAPPVQHHVYVLRRSSRRIE
ncbi:hypothetical protein FOMPIDRAFT_1120190 [Fomitopsis schrenkii]|uniref:Methyltransferase type 11 domain-containing protein n=1 Tax=Fomitopsis schrenkii TaxID=2126942 RepID=S8E957_FOMSC|nr:hypothetical protein FOMPIDRAFT_1120190 [Fomitopsis schrenkii]